MPLGQLHNNREGSHSECSILVENISRIEHIPTGRERNRGIGEAP